MDTWYNDAFYDDKPTHDIFADNYQYMWQGNESNVLGK